MPTILVRDTTQNVYGTDGDDLFESTTGIISGPHTLYGGRGNDAYYITLATNVVEKADGGIDTIVSSTNYKLPAFVENLHLWGNAAGIGNDGNNTIVGGGSATFINGGKGDDHLLGGGSAVDAFQFDAMSGHDTIFDWNSADKIRLAGYSQFSNFGQVKAALTQVGKDVFFKLDAKNDVTLLNTKVSDLNASNFQFTLDLTKLDLRLSFADEFNTFSARATRTSAGTWSTEQGDSRGSDALESRTLMGNGERQIYVDPGFKGRGTTELGLNPFSVKDGILTITGQAAPEAIQNALYGYDYTSGYISTRDTFAQTYGYFEARLQLPAATGSWPAFWLFRKDGIWPPEMDIMEAWNDTTAVQTLHSAERNVHTMTSSSTWVPDGETSFHNYGMLWTPETLTWYLDGVEVFSRPTPADMHSPMYMIVNLAISGAVDDPNFNEQLKVDYVHSYAYNEVPKGIVETYMGKVDGALDGFNAAYYRAQNPDVVAAGREALFHYENFGKWEGRLPYQGAPGLAKPIDPYLGKIDAMPEGFNPDYYAAKNPDVVRSGLDLLHHYLVAGKAEGRKPFDSADTLAAGEIVNLGQRADKPYGFNYVYYALNNPDVVASGMDLFTHYKVAGRSEGRLAFDANAAPALSSDSSGPMSAGQPIPVVPITAVVAEPAAPPVTPAPVPTPAAITPAVVVTPPAVVTPPVTVAQPGNATPAAAHGYWGRASATHDGFNLDYYKANNPDVVAAGVDPLHHYLVQGKTEGRLPFDPTDKTPHADWGKVVGAPDGFNASYYAMHNPDVVLAGMDPLTHYLIQGKSEGRLAYDQASPAAATPPATATAAQAGTFDAAYYALHNPDVMLAGMDPKHHYQIQGKSEGRLGFDDGSGKNLIVGTSGDDVLKGTAAPFEVLTGGAGKDVFKFAPGMGWDTVKDFAVGQDKIDASALFQAYGAPKISDLSWTTGSIAQFSGGESIILLGVTAAQAQLVVLG